MMRKHALLAVTTAVFALLAALSGCDKATAPRASGASSDKGASTAASAAVQEANAPMAQLVASSDNTDMEEAKKGFVAKPSGKILGADGAVIKDFAAFDFVAGPAPATVNPSLWRHALLNAQVGLFKVTDGVYQLRGFDIANMTLIEGKTGWIVVDPLSAKESAAAALAFARQHLGNKAVSAVVFTHAHADHFGGIGGIVSAEQAASSKLPIVASEGFLEEATSENILVGTAMTRRSMYQFGKNLRRNATGNVDTGLGKDVVYGSLGILPPTIIITKSLEKVQLDGLDFVFNNVPGAEAPAELTFSIPSKKLYNGAEILAQTMHNLLPIRGAKVRDSLLWSRYLQDALDNLGDSEIYIAQHNQPIWGNARIRSFIAAHRDVYKYTHDQTVRLMNQGFNAREIADMVQLPPSLSKHMGARGYYGDLRHNVKAVYQLYLGFYDANPANLNPLSPVESGKRFVALIGADNALKAAQTAVEKADYRWAAELLNHVVMADSKNTAARTMLAHTYRQMAYMSEAATWRNSYLTAAMELDNGPPTKGMSKANAIDMLLQVPVPRFIEAMAASLNGPKAEGVTLKINLVLTDKSGPKAEPQSHVMWIENSVMHHKPSAPVADANATVTLSRATLVNILAGVASAKDTLLSDELKVTGSRIDLVRFFGLLDKAPGTFPVVTR